MDVVGIEKAVASRLGCSGCLAGGGWRTLVLLVVALATSAAALFASFSSSSSGRVSLWFSVPFPALSSYGDGGSDSSTSWPTLPLSHAPPPLASPLLPLGPSSSPLATAPPSPTAVTLELIKAKREIADAPMVSNDSDLYPPLFLDFSSFKR
ncbi:hypothetical protein BHE74_00057447 [Ensete ventricosum]|uniref:Uncharacterized protein n=1 Tax=Ensete ventricosum TaxID=4639 RepID=A0A426Z9C2_ENSVE|nr:hypothetical protein B296_00044891 [Ensete ventricosum]RWW37440.1 hypothetical protein BHE74_00057447 [Ensete ventricosum]